MGTTQNINTYSYPNQYTDKYFDQNNNSIISEQKTNNTGVGNNENPNVYSLTGDIINKNDFTHANMTPYFGSKIKGASNDYNTSESILDHKQGAGSQANCKSEQAPLFVPEDNMQFTHGMPNQSDFVQSRMNPSMKVSNVTPWEKIQVGPGLNQGYNNSGNNGFNSGMVARDSWLPKNVDELRTTNNPKPSYNLNGHQGPMASAVKNLGIEGKMEKHLPEIGRAHV